MTPHTRQKAFDRFFASLSRDYARRLGLGYAGTVRKLAPPPLPGEDHGRSRYFLNGVPKEGKAARLVEFTDRMYGSVRKAEHWLESGKGPKPSEIAFPAKSKPAKSAALKRKV